MNYDVNDIINTNAVLKNVTHTLLYEGYALYPYHRAAIKNQKPIPFGVVFPNSYNQLNQHAHSKLQSQTIVTGSAKQIVDIRVRFLQLIKTNLFEYETNRAISKNGYKPVQTLNTNGRSYQAGWQTIEHTINSGHLTIKGLINKSVKIPFLFNKIFSTNNVCNKAGEVVGKQSESISPLSGLVCISAEPLAEQDVFRLTVEVSNTTVVEHSDLISRDDALAQSLLSAHIILHAPGGHFISHQNPGDKWKSKIGDCKNENTWPVLIDESDTILLSSPIILYDHPKINDQSSCDLFDSTEIEEALLLHVNLLSEEEKKNIAQSDEKLRAMLNKVSQITPEEMIKLHSNLKYDPENNTDKINDHESSGFNG